MSPNQWYLYSFFTSHFPSLMMMSVLRSMRYVTFQAAVDSVPGINVSRALSVPLKVCLHYLFPSLLLLTDIMFYSIHALEVNTYFHEILCYRRHFCYLSSVLFLLAILRDICAIPTSTHEQTHKHTHTHRHAYVRTYIYAHTHAHT